MAQLTQITDDAFPGAKSIDFIGQMIVGVEPFGRYWFWSSLADATTYNSLDAAQAETSPDRIQGLIASHNEVLIFGERTIEPWAFAPTDTATFQLQTGSVIESGCASGRTIQRLDNSVFYLTNSGQIARLDGYTPRVVSTVAMEAAIRDLRWSRAFAFTWEDSGHCVYYITFPDGGTWGYDVRQNKWHRRESFGLDRWRINAMCKSNGTYFAGDFADGRVYAMEWGNVYEGCELMPRKLRTGVLHNDTNRIAIHGLRVVANTGTPAVVGADEQPTPPAVFNLLVTGGAKTEGGPLMAKALSTATPEFVGIEQSTGADASGVAAFYDGTFAVAGSGGGRHSTDLLETFQTGTISGNPDRIVGGSGGFLAIDWINTIYGNADWQAANPPVAYTDAALTGTLAIGFAGGKFWRSWYGVIYSAPAPSGPWTEVTTYGTLIDICDHDGAIWATISRGFNGHAGDTSYHSVYRFSDTSLSDPTMFLSRAHAETHRPTQLCSGWDEDGTPVLVAYCFGGGTWTSRDNWATWVDTGIAGTEGPAGLPDGGDNIQEAGGRRIAFASGNFYVISGTAGTGSRDQCVVSTDGGRTYSAPITLPIAGLISIASSYNSSVELPPDYADPCTPMEGGFFQVRYSNDGANNYSSYRDFPPPVTGQFLQNYTLRRLGMARHRVWEFMDTSNRPQDVLAASIIAE